MKTIDFIKQNLWFYKQKANVCVLLLSLLPVFAACSDGESFVESGGNYNSSGTTGTGVVGTYEGYWRVSGVEAADTRQYGQEPVRLTVGKLFEFSSLPCRTLAESFLDIQGQPESLLSATGKPYTMEYELNGYSSKSLYFLLEPHPTEYQVTVGGEEKTVRLEVLHPEAVYSSSSGGQLSLVLTVRLADSDYFTDEVGAERRIVFVQTQRIN